MYMPGNATEAKMKDSKNAALSNSTATTKTKRDAFGEIQNCAIPRNIAAVKAQNELKDCKRQTALCLAGASANAQSNVSSKRQALASKRTTTNSKAAGNMLTRSKTGYLVNACAKTTTDAAAMVSAKSVTKKLQQMQLAKLAKAPPAATLRSLAAQLPTISAVAALLCNEKENIPLPSEPKLKLDHAPANKQPAAPRPQDTVTHLQFSNSLQPVVDIDAGDGHNLFLVSTYVNDIYSYMYTVEEKQSIRPNHLLGQAEITPHMRAVLMDWLSDVQLQFHLTLEVFQKAIAIIDRYLQIVQNTTRHELQLVGVTALFIATKYEELLPPSIKDFIYITDDAYTAKQICHMERQILKTLDFNLERPVAIQFLRRYSKAANANAHLHTMAKYFLELSALIYDLAACRPSQIAAAALYLALQLFNSNAESTQGWLDAHWTPTLQYYARYTPAQLRPIAKYIAKVARHAPNAKLQASFKKYSSQKMYAIALKTELYSKLMDTLINTTE